MPVLWSSSTSIIFLFYTLTDVAIGSTVTVRHVNTQGGYLHSHSHYYPGGSERV
jgi:dolichyl-phosphate-mannose--protein O-mannosyl transferase